MRSILILSCLLFFFACRHKENKSVSTNTTSNLSITPSSILDTPQKESPIPPGVFIDSSSSYDNIGQATIDIKLPGSDDPLLKGGLKKLASYITSRRKSFLARLYQRQAEDTALKEAIGSEFTVWPYEIYKDQQLFSCLLVIETYYAGSFHPVMEYYSFNYDLREEKEIHFADYFSLPSKSDSTALLNLINRSFGDTLNIKAPKCYAFDFDLNDAAIIFNFDDYEVAGYGAGMQRAPFCKEDLLPFIKPVYRK